MISVQPVTLQGNGVRLEPLSMQHADGLSKAAADGELWNLFFTFVPNPNEVADSIQSALQTQSAGHMLPWAVKDEAYGEVWEGKGLNVSRAQVPGGWLVFIVHATGPVGQGGLTFVPDPSHTWDGASLPSLGSQDTGAG